MIQFFLSTDRFATESPTSDLDGRTPKGRGKRGRTCTSAARSEINGSDRKLRSNRCTTGAASKSGMSSAGSSSPVRSDIGQSGAPAAKKPRGSESAGGSGSGGSDAGRGASKTGRSESRMSVSADAESSATEGALIECPAPNCSKKYRHISGLRYHQSRSHPTMNFDDDAEEVDGYGKLNSKVKCDMDIADMESASDIDKNEAADGLTGSVLHANDTVLKHDKKGKSKSKSAVKHALAETHDTASSLSANAGKSSSDDSSASDKQKYRKKDRERMKDVTVLDQVRDPEVTGDDVDVRQPVPSGGRACENPGQLVSVNEGRILSSDSVDPTDDSSTVERGGETVSVIRMAAEVNSAVTPISNGDLHSNMFETCEGTSAVNNAVLMLKVEPNQTVLSASDRCAVSPGQTLTSKKSKTTPTKYGTEYDNPLSPAYSDISDANDSAPMLEKEATPSASVDDDDLSAGGASVIERCPISQHLADSFTGPYSGSASSSLYGQPPCLTPAVVPSAALDATIQQSGGIKNELSIGHLDDRACHSSGIRTNSVRPPPPTRVPNDLGNDLTDRSLGSLQRSASRSHGDSSSPQPQQPAPTIMPPNIFMQYPYAAGSGGYPPLELLQHPEYRAQYERFMSQGMLRRPDQPPASLSRPPGDLQPDFKGFSGSLKQGDADRKSKSDGQLPPGTLPTPPVLIPDRGVVSSFDEQDSRVAKSKSGERRDDSQRSAYPYPQHYSTGGDRPRRHDESVPGKESSSNKPSAVVAPQARDRILASGSGKPRSEDQSRSVPSSHDQARPSHKLPAAKGNPVPSQQDSASSRQQKDVPLDKCGRDDKSSAGARGSSSGAAYKKDESGISISPITSVPLPLAPTYPPYYPYLPNLQAPFESPFYGGLNPMIGYAGAPPGSFLHATQVGYLPPSAGGDVAAIMSPAGGPHLSPSDGKPRDGPQRGFYPGGDPPGGGQSCAPVHKIHELKEVAKGGSGASGESSQSSGGALSGSGLRDIVRPESRGGAVGGSGGLPKDLERGGASSPPTQRHVHTHHHMHMLGPHIPPLFGGVFPGDRTYPNS
jgi:hypothetical protein